MRQSLSKHAMSGKVHPLTGMPIVPIGRRANGDPIWPIMGGGPENDGDGTGDGDGGDGGGDGDQGGDGGGQGGNGGDGAGGDGTSDDRNPRIKELSDENARKRNENKRLADELAAAQARLKEIDDADKSELEKAQADLNEATAKNETNEAAIRSLRIDNAFLAQNKYVWKNPTNALKLADLSEVTIDEDGKVTGLDKALDKLAKSDPYLLKGEDDDDDDTSPTPTGQPPAPKRDKGNPKRAELEKKYPGIRR